MTTLAIMAVLPDNAVKSMSDKGLRLIFDTQEPTEEQFRDIFRMKGKSGKLVFASDDSVIKPEDIDLEGKSQKEGKSPSQKLRNKMYVFYQNNYSDISNFQEWYEQKLEYIGNQFLEKVEK